MPFWNRWLGRRPPSPDAAAPATTEPAPEFPFPLVAVPGVSAVETWLRLRDAWRPEGHSPVLLGDRAQVEAARGALASYDVPTERILEIASGLAPDAMLEERLRAREEDGLDVPLGRWPLVPPGEHELSAHCDVLSREPRPLVYIAEVPTPRPWEIPAFLRYGGWNECPGPEEQVAIHRRWFERYGAELYAMAGDVVECWVARPPSTRDAAEALAREQFLYCGDIVDQGTTALLPLAAQLKGARAWFFWWD